MSSQSIPPALLVPAQAVGLNVAGGIGREAYDRLAPDGLKMGQLFSRAQSVVVLGSGGPALWLALRSALASTHAHLLHDENPLDSWLKENALIWQAGPWRGLGVEGVVSSAAHEPLRLSFQALALAGGLGAPGRLGLLMHPVYGPWWAIRLAVFLREPLEETGFAALVSPCEDCAAPCQRACHGGAVKAAGENFDWQACQSHRPTDRRCQSRCDARLACPVGRDHAYPPQALAYHMTRDKTLLGYY